MKTTHLSPFHRTFCCVTLLLLTLLVVWLGNRAQSPAPVRPLAGQNLAVTAPQARTTPNYGQVPLSFEANHGQAKEPVKFLARGTNATLYLTPTEAALEVHETGKPEQNETAQQTAMVKMKLLGANDAPVLQGHGELPGKSNYFMGKDTKEWKTNIPTYQQVKYAQVYEGIDLVYYGNQQQLEDDFIVQPGADPNKIKFRLEGAEQVSLNAHGDLVLQTEAGEIKQHKPVIYQEVNGERKEIAGKYVLHEGEVSFAVSAYDPSQPLVIDPVIVYATYLGSELGGAVAITADKEGQAYVAMNYGPAATPGAYQNGTGFSVLKLNKAGTAILYSATMGGSEFDRVFGMTVDAQGNCYLTGQAISSAFPVTPGAFQTDFGITCGSCYNAFVMKLNPTGSGLVYSTFLKGEDTLDSKLMQGLGIAVDAQGNAYVTGNTNARDFPVTSGAVQPTINTYKGKPTPDGFVTKLNATGTALHYSTYLGSGSGAETGTDIKVDAAGNAYVTGLTGNGFVGSTQPLTTGFPVTAGAYQTPDSGSRYGFVSKFSPNGQSLVYSTLIGTIPGSFDRPRLVLDAQGNVFLSGRTGSSNFPTTPGAFKPNFTAQYWHAFVTKLNAAGNGLIYSTFVGGRVADASLGIGIDAEGNATITGGTDSPDFPQTHSPITLTRGASFITKLNATGSQLLYSQLFEGVTSRQVTIDSQGAVLINGSAWNSFQPTPGAYQTTPGSTCLTKINVPKSATTVSAANYSGSPLACEAIVSAFGTGLATVTQSATTLPLPTSLGGTTVKVRDSSGTERDAPIFFVSPTQVNFQIPAGTANGNAALTISAQDGTTFISNVEIANVVPSLFSADATGRGIAAAHAQRAGAITFEQVVKFDPFKGQFVALPIDLGPASEQVYVILYGTGLRLRSHLNTVTASIGGTPATVSYAGAQPDFVGLDQINVLIPRSLIGRGLVDVVLNVEGKAANTAAIPGLDYSFEINSLAATFR